jgi:hypothetical protein
VVLDTDDRKDDDGCGFGTCCNGPAAAPATCSLGKFDDDSHLPVPRPDWSPADVNVGR